MYICYLYLLITYLFSQFLLKELIQKPSFVIRMLQLFFILLLVICVPIDGLIRLDKWLIRLNPYWPHAVAKFCGNVELCRHTALVVFSDPYRVSQYNHWTSPYLDQDAKAVQEDNLLKLEVSELKSKYCMIRTNFSLYVDRKSTRLNSSHSGESRMPSSA